MCKIVCFNPYFNGYRTSTLGDKNMKNINELCFNPYFNGYSTST